MQNLKNYGEWAVVTGATDGIGKAYAAEVNRPNQPANHSCWPSPLRTTLEVHTRPAPRAIRLHAHDEAHLPPILLATNPLFPPSACFVLGCTSHLGGVKFPACEKQDERCLD